MIALIPAYRPPAALEALAWALRAAGLGPIIVVDDGSGAAWEGRFARLGPGVKVVRHERNRGKGAALKTGVAYILRNYPACQGVVTADADGQHAADDVLRVAARWALAPEALVLGARDFSAASGCAIPWRSRVGNAVTRRALRALAGADYRDTQTGLRAIPRRLLPRLQTLPARGYAFELEMLIAARHQGIAVLEEPIRTLYLEANRESHFHPLRDSMRIYFALLRFALAGLASAGLDNLLFAALYAATGQLFASQAGARAVAGTFNYVAVKRAVFLSDQPDRALLPRYALLAALNLALGYEGIRMATRWLPVSVYAAKVGVEGILFLGNFAVQRDWIFTRRPPEIARAKGAA